MAWTIELSETAIKKLGKLQPQVQRRIFRFLEERISTAENVRGLGQALNGSWTGHWKYRVGDYRLICELHDKRLVVIVIDVGDRKDVYR